MKKTNTNGVRGAKKYLGKDSVDQLRTAKSIHDKKHEEDCDIEEESEENYIFKIIAILGLILVALMTLDPHESFLTLIFVIIGINRIWNM